MSWEAYRRKRTYRISLESLGLDGFWVELREYKTLTLAEASVFTGFTPENPDFKKLCEGLSEVVMDWNLTHPGTGELLPRPFKNPEAIRHIPLEVLTFINSELARREGVAVPETRGTSPGA